MGHLRFGLLTIGLAVVVEGLAGLGTGEAVISVEAGERLYATHCAQCHGDGQWVGARDGAAPLNARGHVWHHPDHLLVQWILHGKPPTEMPAFRDRLDETDARSILAYVKTWWSPGQQATQAELSARYKQAL